MQTDTTQTDTTQTNLAEGDGAIEWKLQSSSTHGPYESMTHTAGIDPWGLAAAQALAGALAAGGWTPVLPTDAEGTGVAGGHATLQRITSITPAGREERFWLVGSIAFLDADRTAALYAELLSGRVEQRLALADTLAHVRATSVGLRWVGSIVRPGRGQRARIREVGRQMAERYRVLLPQGGWVQVPFFAPNDALRMSEVKIGEVLGPPAPPSPRGSRTRLQVRSSRSGRWRSIGARPVLPGPDGSLRVGTHGFAAERQEDGYVYLTVVGGTEPTYRLLAADYKAITHGRGK